MAALLMGVAACAAADAAVSSTSYVTNGLVALYDGIENAGVGLHDASARTWADLTGHGHDGVLGESVSWGAAGWVNDADGAPVTLGAGVSAVTATTNFTIEICSTPTRGNARECFFSQYSSKAGSFALEHNSGTYATGHLRIFMSGHPDIKAPVVIAAGETAQFAVSVSPDSQKKVWKNGTQVLADAQQVWNMGDATAGFVIGGEFYRPGMAFHGTYHALRLYDRALTDDEAALNAAVDAVRFQNADPAECVLPDGWRFDADANLLFRTRAIVAGDGAVGVDGGGGAVTNDVWTPVNTATNISLAAIPGEGSGFVCWSGDVDVFPAVDAESPEISFALANRPVVLTAVFRPSSASAFVPAVTSYVRDGLVMLFDGADNAGVGRHDAASRQWADLSGNGRHGELGESVTWTDDGWHNESDGQPVALPAGAAGDAASAAIAAKDFTMEFAVTPLAGRSRTRECFFGQYNCDGKGGGFNFEHNSSGTLADQLRVYYGDRPNHDITSMKVAQGECAVVSLVSADFDQRVYKNGKLGYVGTNEIRGTLASAGLNVIGGEPTRGKMAFHGDYHAFRLYSRPLAACEVLQNVLVDSARRQVGGEATFWTPARSGSWMDGANWSFGVPCRKAAAAVLAAAEAVDVVVPAGVPSVTNLFVANTAGLTTLALEPGVDWTVEPGAILSLGQGAAMDVPERSAVTFDKSTFSVAGGQMRIDGGDVLVTGFDSGVVSVSGGASHTGRLTIASGRLAATDMPSEGKARVLIGAGGRLEMTGGQMDLAYTTKGLTHVALNDGGDVELSGTARLSYSGRGLNFGSGTARLRDKSVLYIGASAHTSDGTIQCRMGLKPGGALPSVLTVDDEAEVQTYDGNGSKGAFYLNYDAPGKTSVLNWNSSKTLRFNFTFCIGMINGTGVVNQTNGRIEGGGFGLRIAQPSAPGNRNARPVGIVNVSGGEFVSSGAWQGDDTLQGFVVGAGIPAILDAPGFFEGHLNVSGGVATNCPGSAYLAVGVGYARGEVCQTGGAIGNGSRTHQTIVGAFGGTGVWRMSGGTSTSAGDVYVGGIQTNQMAHAPCMLHTVARVDAQSATGVVEVAGGTFKAAGTLYAGQDGVARLAVGPSGRIEAANAVLKSAALSFGFGADGVGALSVPGSIALGEGVSLTVDTTAYSGSRRHFRLIECPVVSGSFASVEVQGGGRVVQSGDGYWMDLNKGTLVIFR